MTELTITVHGTPAPQGSKRHVGNGVMIESSQAVKPWREAVKWAAMDAASRSVACVVPYVGPVRVQAIFKFPRPKSHYRTGRNAHLLRDDAPEYKASKPDIEKLERSTFDALTDAGVWRDDAQVVETHSTKVYSDTPGAHLIIEEVAQKSPQPTSDPRERLAPRPLSDDDEPNGWEKRGQAS